MKTITEIIKSIETIDEAYRYVEHNIVQLEANHDVTDFWVAFRNKTTSTEALYSSDKCELIASFNDNNTAFSASILASGTSYQLPSLVLYNL